MLWAVNFETSKNLLVRGTMSPFQNIHKYNWMSLDENQTDHIWAERIWHSSLLDAWSLRGVKCDVQVKQSHYRPGQTLKVPQVEAPRFQDNRHTKVVRLSALRTGRLYPQEIYPVLISVRRTVDLRATVRPEGLCQRKIPIIPSGIKPVTFRLVAQSLNQLRHRIPLNVMWWW